jgi:hypothetical protein
MANFTIKINPLLLRGFSHPIVKALLAQFFNIDVIGEASDTQDSNLMHTFKGVFCMQTSGAMPTPP